MDLKDLFDNGYNKFPQVLTRSYYWRYILSTNDKIVLMALWDSAILDKYFYENGILIANIKQNTLLVHKIGNMSYPTMRRSLKHLHDIGAIVKLNKKFRNNRYFLGFRHKNGQDRIYLLYHLLLRFETPVSENIENQLTELKSDSNVNDIWTIPKIEDIRAYCLKSDYKHFIIDNIDNPRDLVYKRILNGDTLFYTLFTNTNFYRKPLPSGNYYEKS